MSDRNLRRRLAYHLVWAMRASLGVPCPLDGCVMFQADVHLAATGSDPVAHWRGRYTTARGLKRVMGPGGLLDCMKQVARAKRWRLVRPARARVGDIGLAMSTTGYSVVRQLHKNEWIGRNDMGWSKIPTEYVRVAWAVT